MLSRRAFLAGAPLAALSACAAKSVWAPDSAVAAATYSHSGPPAVTLFTVFNVGSDRGAHTGMRVNGSQRVLFDPAGSFAHPKVIERNDVIFGMTDQLWDVYVDYHTRTTYYSRTQYIEVPAQVAEHVLRAVMQNGPVPQAMCARTTSRILGATPGFPPIRNTWYPEDLYAQFAELPGVSTREFRDSDDPDKGNFWEENQL